MAIFNNKDGKVPELRNSGDAVLSIIAAGMHFVGDLEGPGLIKIDGRIEGSISGARQIIVGREGAVRGNVHATEVILAGTVDGTVIGSERVELQGTATLNGDLHTRLIVVNEGARINGTVRMSETGGADALDRPAVQVMR
jgi:cytoskeletal protein CcmA (bactofilin family)